jgi:hypothetical protein
VKRDLLIIAVSIVAAVILVQTDAFASLFALTKDTLFLNSFISGFFFTSIFTTVPAIAALAELSRTGSLVVTALFGALGAMFGDLVIFLFIKDKFSKHLFELTSMKGAAKRLKHLMRQKYFRWFTFLLGGIIIASPLPDEVGLSILGISKTKTSRFLLMSFFFNFIGIIIIGYIAGII